MLYQILLSVRAANEYIQELSWEKHTYCVIFVLRALILNVYTFERHHS